MRCTASDNTEVWTFVLSLCPIFCYIFSILTFAHRAPLIILNYQRTPCLPTRRLFYKYLHLQRISTMVGVIPQMWLKRSCVEGGKCRLKTLNTRHSERATNRVIVLQFIENMEGITSVIFKSHNDIYQFRQEKWVTLMLWHLWFKFFLTCNSVATSVHLWNAAKERWGLNPVFWLLTIWEKKWKMNSKWVLLALKDKTEHSFQLRDILSINWWFC